MSTLLLSFCFCLSNCGYALKRSSSETLKKLGINTVYIRSIENRTLAAGVETLVYNALVRNIAAQRSVKLTNDKSIADAVILGTVQRADYHPSQSTTADQIEPVGSAEDNKRVVATHYQATLEAEFALYRYSSKSGISDSPLIATRLARQKQFIANNYIGVLGTTSSILNESGFRRAVIELSDELSLDFNESFFSFF